MNAATPSLSPVDVVAQGKNASLKNFALAMFATSILFVVGLAWNDALTGAIETFLPKKSTQVFGLFLYAIVLSLVAFAFLKSLLHFSGYIETLNFKLL